MARMHFIGIAFLVSWCGNSLCFFPISIRFNGSISSIFFGVAFSLLLCFHGFFWLFSAMMVFHMMRKVFLICEFTITFLASKVVTLLMPLLWEKVSWTRAYGTFKVFFENSIVVLKTNSIIDQKRFYQPRNLENIVCLRDFSGSGLPAGRREGTS